ncbi:TonB-dependent receptor [Capnocytophaga cynodegmi]|uniref:TonB-dependent receptor n=1 Tax=Capnocytophaga cynodegmi TaxID=28189 RepID=UPI0038599403
MRFCFGIFFYLFLTLFVSAQTIDLENIDKQIIEKFQKPTLSLSGSVSGNSVYYHSKNVSPRAPFTYFLSGNLKIGVYDWSIPLSYNYTNQGSNFKYKIPFRFNRLSLHPKYKSLQFHLGDVSMNFSSYTYSGLPFTGFGFEFVPEKFPLRGSIFAGRLQQAIEYNSDFQESKPYYERWGYGLNLQWIKPEYELRAIGFYAKDKINSLKGTVPESLGVYPERGISYSFFGKVKPFSFLHIYAEYAISDIVKDIRLLNNDSLSSESSSLIHNALNTGINFSFNLGTIGFRYERIDPNYRTLGAYYFINDLENITLNTSLRMLNSRLILSANIGKQKDNLKGKKIIDSNQWVGAINTNFKATDRIDLSLNYSNFTSFTNRRLNQFDDINQNPLHLQRPEDSLNYRQVSQNLLAMVQYQLSENQQLSFNYSINDAVNSENNVTRVEGKSRFHNGGVTYSLSLPKNKLVITPMFNVTQSEISGQNSFLLGPSLNINKSLLNNKLTASLGSSFNYGQQHSGKSQNLIFRLNFGYTMFEKHQFQLSTVQSFHKTVFTNNSQSNKELIISFGYNYHFEKIPILSSFLWNSNKSKIEKRTPPKSDVSVKSFEEDQFKKTANSKTFRKENQKKLRISNKIRFKHNKQLFEGNSENITRQLTSVKKSKNYSELEYMPWLEKRLDSLLEVMRLAETDISLYKKEKNNYLNLLDQVKNKERELNEIVFGVLNKLYVEAVGADNRVKQRILDSKQNLDREKNTIQEQNFENSFEIYIIHHQMKKDFYGLSVSQISNPKGIIKELLEQTKMDIYKVLDNKKQSKLEKTNSIQLLITDYYYKKYKRQINESAQ